MDKRFLLALVLTAVVVIATPWLFGTQSTRGVSKAVRDTVATSDSISRAPSDTAILPVATNAERPALAGSADSSRNVALAVPETTTVSQKLADYTFNNIGAVPISVELKSYKALDGSKRNVRLESKSGPLLSFRLFLPGDTVDLARAAFKPTQSGPNALSYSANVRGADVVIRYTFVPDSYLVR